MNREALEMGLVSCEADGLQVAFHCAELLFVGNGLGIEVFCVFFLAKLQKKTPIFGFFFLIPDASEKKHRIFV
jgi:hypothetical protein